MVYTQWGPRIGSGFNIGNAELNIKHRNNNTKGGILFVIVQDLWVYLDLVIFRY